jgi:hypothetical protein
MVAAGGDVVYYVACTGRTNSLYKIKMANIADATYDIRLNGSVTSRMFPLEGTKVGEVWNLWST